MHTTENEKILSAIRIFLTKENLSTSDSHVYTLLKYPASTIMAAVTSFDESAVLLPIIVRDSTRKLHHQLLAIFDSIVEQYESPPPPLSTKESKKLHSVLQKYT